MAQINANGIQLEYDTFGDPSGRPLLLIMGLGTQMTRWQPEFCELLVAEGNYVIRFDNRDIGLSEKLDNAGAPDMMALFAAAQAGEPLPAPYDLSDMARDTVGLLDGLNIEAAHVCGASMGGMIAQHLAIEHAPRLLSMTSIMSSTGNPELPPSTPEAMGALLSPAGTSLEDVLERAVQISGAIGSPAYRGDEAEIKARAQADYERSFYPVGVARQMAAIAASGNRKPALAGVSTPSLIIHGDADPLVPIEGGIDTHEAIAGSRMVTIEGMGHDLPEALWGQIVGEIAQHVAGHHPAS